MRLKMRLSFPIVIARSATLGAARRGNLMVIYSMGLPRLSSSLSGLKKARNDDAGKVRGRILNRTRQFVEKEAFS